jgi:hypothetical protein
MPHVVFRIMQTCPSCGHVEPEASRFCTRCGAALRDGFAPTRSTQDDDRAKEELNLPILYLMAGGLILALIVPPWETPPTQPPAFLGFHFVLDAPPAGTETGVISRLLLTVEVVTIAVAGLYFSWLFRKRG